VIVFKTLIIVRRVYAKWKFVPPVLLDWSMETLVESDWYLLVLGSETKRTSGRQW